MAKTRSRGKKTKESKKEILKVYCGDCSSYSGNWIEDSILVDKLHTADIVVLPGGSDWAPFWYDDSTGRRTNSYGVTDLKQMKIILEAMKNDKLIVGICRGLQGIHVAAGGRLIQHVDNHGGDRHLIIDTYTGQEYYVNSLHHQMVDLQSLLPEEYELLAYVPTAISKTYLNGLNLECYHKKSLCYYKNDDNFKEPEAVYYTKINAIGFQYHPEMMGIKDPALKYTNELIRNVIEFKKELYDETEQYRIILALEDKIEIIEETITDNRSKSVVKSTFLLPKISNTTNLQPTCTDYASTETTKNDKTDRSNLFQEW